MGAAAQTYCATQFDQWMNPDCNPGPEVYPQHEPTFGFQKELEARKLPKTTQEEMYWARVPQNRQDYCVDYVIEYLRCREENYPFKIRRCEPQVHDWQDCQHKDAMMRMKQYERERRLLHREKRIEAKREAITE